MKIKPGSRWQSVVCSAEVVVVRPPTAEGVPQCGGVDMVPLGEQAGKTAIREGFDGGCAAGKRYRAAQGGLELLCSKAGEGALGFGGTPLGLVEAKQLPSSD